MVISALQCLALNYLEFLITALVFYFLGKNNQGKITNPLPPIYSKLEEKTKEIFHPTIEPGIIHRPTAREVFLRKQSDQSKAGKEAMKELLDKLNKEKPYES